MDNQSGQPKASPYGDVSEIEVIAGGCHRDLVFRAPDPEKPGSFRLETIRTLIRKVGFQKMDVLAKSWGRMSEEAALYLEVEPDRVNQLLEDSFETAIQEGRRLNFTLLQKWLKWQGEALVATGEADQLNMIIEKVMRESVAQKQV